MTTMQEAITQVRNRLGINAATYINDQTIQQYLNYSFAELYELLVESNEDWNVKRLNFSITSSDPNDGYLLPYDFFKVLRVDRMLSSDQAYILARINIRDEPLYGPVSSVYLSGPSGYNTEVNSDGYAVLRVFPTSQKQGNYRILYYPAFTDYNLNDRIVLGPPGQKFEEYGIVDAMIKISGQDETDASLFIQQKAAVMVRIKAAAAARDIGQASPPPQSLPWYERGNCGNGGNFGGGWF